LKHLRLKPLLYLICLLTDFSAFVVIFAVSRDLAEQQAGLWYLGMVGAGFSFSAGMASLVSGWLSNQFDSRIVFVSGSATVALAVVACGSGDTATAWFMPRYCLLGMGLGSIYPTLIGWLNRNENAHTNRQGVSRTLILYCVSWNVGMMCGQLAAGSLFELGLHWLYGVAFGVAVINVGLSIAAAWTVTGSFRDSGGRTTDSAVANESSSAADPASLETAVAFKRLSWIANLGGTFGGSLVFHLLPDLVVSIGIPADSHGGLLAYGRGVVIVSYLMMHFFSFWHYRFSTSMASQFLGVAGLIMISQAESMVTLCLGLTLHAQLVGYNYFSGLFYTTAGSSPDGRTLAAGIHEATLAAGMAAGTVAGGILGSMIGNRAPYVLAAVVLVALIVVQIIAFCRWFVIPGRDNDCRSH